MGLNALQVLAEIDRWQMLVVLVKALTYGTSLTAAGGALFLILFTASIHHKDQVAIRFFVIRASITAMIFSVLRIGVMSAMLNDGWAGMLDVAMTHIVLSSGEGLATGLRLAGLLIILVWSAIPFRLQAIGRSCAVPGIVLTTISFALVGHSREGMSWFGSTLLPQFLLDVHLLAVAFWLGALWPLHRVASGEDMVHIGALMRRFGERAVLVAGLLIAAGGALLWFLLGGLEDLWTSAYGQMFAAKLMSVVLLLGFAGLNKLWLTPRLLAGNPSALRQLQVSIRFEIGLAGLILLMTAGFTSLVGPPTIQ